MRLHLRLSTALLVCLSACATATSVWVKPGQNQPVRCLAMQYQFGPYNDIGANNTGAAFGSTLEQLAEPLLAFNGLRLCGVGSLGMGSRVSANASHVLVLVSKAGTFNRQVSPGYYMFQVDAELRDLATGEIVFRGKTLAGGGNNEVAVSGMISKPLNSMSEAGLVSIPGHRLKYATPPLTGKDIGG